MRGRIRRDVRNISTEDRQLQAMRVFRLRCCCSRQYLDGVVQSHKLSEPLESKHHPFGLLEPDSPWRWPRRRYEGRETRSNSWRRVAAGTRYSQERGRQKRERSDGKSELPQCKTN